MPKKEKYAEKRSMSPHVVARAYRPPEVALLEQYDQSADIWSLGIVLYELMFVQANRKNILTSKKRNRFKYTDANLDLSPLRKDELDENDISKNDLIVKQIQSFDLADDDMSFISDPTTKENVQVINQEFKKKPFQFKALQKLFSKELVNLVK